MKNYLRLISLWLCFGSLYLLIQRLFYKDEHDILRILTIVTYSWLYVFGAVILTEASKKKLNLFLYLLLVVFLSITVEYLFMYIGPDTWKDKTMIFFGDICGFTLIWISSILASKLMIGGYKWLKNVLKI
jgi:hypothetical protein